MDKEDVENIEEVLTRIREGNQTEGDIALLQQALAEGRITIAHGERSVGIGGDAEDVQIFVGDHETIGGHKITIGTLSAEALDLLLREEYQPPELPEPGVLPDPGLLPTGSRMIFARNFIFTGREKDLHALADSLLYHPESTAAVISQNVVTTGLVGIGKTQLAVEFCYRYGRFFRGVHWINAEEDMDTEIAACGERMGIKSWPQSLSEQVQATLNAWERSRPRLLVLDYAKAPELIREWIPQLQGHRVLLTSRRPRWPRDLGLIERHLPILPRDKSLELLRRLAPRLKKVSDKELNPIADIVGDLPLALDLAGRYLSEIKDLSPSKYHEQLDEAESILAHSSLQNWVNDNPTKHDTDLAKVFLLSWQQLADQTEIDVLAKRLFRICGYLAPNVTIQFPLFSEAIRAGEVVESPKVTRALRRLYELGLLTPTDGGSTIPSLLREFAKIQDVALDKSEGDTSVLSGVVDALIKLASEAYKSGLPAQFALIRPHLKATAQAAEDTRMDKAGALWKELGTHLRQVAELEAAKVAYERAIAADEAVFGADHESIARDINDLGFVLKDLGDLDGAKAAFERALTIDEAIYGEEHPNVAEDIRGLGFVLKDRGDLIGAKNKFERALSIYDDYQSPDKHEPCVVRTICDLGFVLKDLGDFDGAKATFERAVTVAETAWDPDHPEVAICLTNLGFVMKDQGDLEGAKSNFERALEIDKTAYSQDHPNVAKDLTNLGFVVKDLGKLGEAEIEFRRALEINETVYSPEHPNVAKDLTNLGFVLKDKGDLEGAKKVFERAVDIDKAAYSSDSNNFASRLEIMGYVWRDLGELSKARTAFERSLSIFEKNLPAEHSVIQIVRANLEELDEQEGG